MSDSDTYIESMFNIHYMLKKKENTSMIFYISIFSYPGAGLAAGEGTPGREGRDCHRRWIGRGRAGAGSSCTAP